MPDRIEPALTAEQWAELVVDLPGEHAWTEPGYLCANDNDRWGTSRVPAHIAIALANAALPDDDPRKITRERVARLRSLLQVSDDYAGDDFDESGAFLHALESYLPPVAP